MTTTIGAGLSTSRDSRTAGSEAAGMAAAALAGQQSDLTVVFASGAHLAASEALLDAIHGVLDPRALVGCGAGGVLACGRELESGTALAVWTAAFDGEGEATPFHATVAGGDDDEPTLQGLPALAGARGMILLPDPYSFPTDAVLTELGRVAPAIPVLGGLSSQRTGEGDAVLFFGEEVCEEGAVGVALHGIEMLPCVSQGAAPLGREITITAAEGNVIHELAGRPALQTVEAVLGELTVRERELVTAGVLVGLVIDGGKPEYEQGDFLVRGVLGADPQTGQIAVGAAVREGQVLRLHARDPKSATEDLRRELAIRLSAIAERPPAGALVFSCNGRGRAMFGAPDHDAGMLEQQLLGAPAAGFFAAGEIGPVGGRSFLHGFTATVAVFPG